MTGRGALCFGEFELDPETGELRRSGNVVRLQQQPFKVLAMLAARPGTLVSREELRERLWGAETHVDFEQGLNFCVRQVRAALGDQADAPRFVETLPRRGYRFVAPVSVAPQRVAPAAELAVPFGLRHEEGATPRRRRVRVTLAAALALGAALAATTPLLTAGRAASARRTLLAVLPFDTLGGHDDEYLGDGLTEEMINELGRLRPDRLGVIARTSAMTYKGARKPIPVVGRELGVDYVLEGTVERLAGRVRVAVQLVRVRDQSQLWADRYESDARDALRVEEEIAGRIARSLKARLVGGAEEPDSRGPANAEAYELFLRARHALAEPGDGPRRSLPLFGAALAQDPGYAPAHAGRAEAYLRLGGSGALPPREAYPEAAAEARRALELDPRLAPAWVSLGVERTYYEWDFAGAERAYERAITLRPGLASAYYWYAGLLSATGRHAAALKAIGRAQALDPLSTAVNGDVGWYSFFARRYDDAIAQLRVLIEIQPDELAARDLLVHAYGARGLWDQALAEARELARRRNAPHAPALAGLSGRAGYRRYLELRLASLEARLARAAPGSPGRPSAGSLLLAHAALGENAAALDWLESARDERWPWLVAFLDVDPRLDGLRAEPRFRAVLRDVGLPELPAGAPAGALSAATGTPSGAGG